MTLYAAMNDPLSQRVRIVLAEKSLDPELIEVNPARPPEDLLDLNPYHSVPTLVDRDLVLYDSRVIIDYLEERFPAPPLMPVDPMMRARFRVVLYQVERDWYGGATAIASALAAAASTEERKQLPTLRRALCDSIVQIAALFALKNYFLSDDFSLVDASIAPILWRLPSYGIALPSQADSILKYAERVFARPAFLRSLSEEEQRLR